MKQKLLAQFIAFLFPLCGFSQIPEKTTAQLKAQVEKEYASLFELYKDLHQTPELSFFEKNTSKKMADELRKLGFEVTENLGGYGVVGVFKNGKGPTVMLRTDTDALPVKEETDVPYISKVTTKDEAGVEVPVMHACGHDVHMTSWVGAARLLVDMKKSWSGTLIMVAQPAEERSGGSKAMLKEGLYEKFPLPEYALALHASASLPAGKIGYTSGYALANVDMVDITVFGEGGHGAYPHTTKDPIVLASKIVMALQTIVAREISPLEPAVVTVGSIHGGTKGNVIPAEVKMELTLRSYSDEVREKTIKAIRRILKGEAMAAGISEDKYPKLFIRDESTPATFNNPDMVEEVMKGIASVVGKEQVEEVPPVMAGEDFGRFNREKEVKGFLFWVGGVPQEKFDEAKKSGKTLPSLHSAYFAPDPEPTLKAGVMAMTAGALQLFMK